MLYVEAILPLPLYSTFTYSVPDSLADKISVGSRILVQFGRRKYYTALVASLCSTPPKDYEVKEIVDLLDSSPIVRRPQIQFWEWMADYYMCAPGDVMKAALPSALKPESETVVTLNRDYEPSAGEPMSEKEALVFSLLEHEGKMRLTDIEHSLEIGDVARLINIMFEKGIIEVAERMVNKYRAVKKTMVKLTIDRDDHDALHEFMHLVSRSRKQEQMLLNFLDQSRFLNRSEPLVDIEKEQLLKGSNGSPAILKALCDKGILTTYKVVVNRFESAAPNSTTSPASLSEAQQKALTEIRESFRDYSTVLLHGVTGSGKTEIYTHLIDEVIRQGNQVLYLVPEISLTTQLTDRVRKVFGNRLIVYHSKFSDSERVDIWKRVLSSNEPLIVLGARSALFLPFHRLGLVIVDEEHESSYKQYDPAPRYNARDSAIMLAHMHGAKTLLASATPSIETYYKSLNKKYGLVKLTERFNGANLPDVDFIDLREMRKRKTIKGMISTPLKLITQETLEQGGQAIIFQNRRGFAPVAICRTCGWTPKCRDCDVSLVYHKQSNMLRCHYCGYSTLLPRVCPACGENTIDVYGYGTERIAEDLHQLLPGHRVARMDLDTTRNKDGYQEIIEEFSSGETDILVGTQMVTKGLDFDNVRLVGVINADTLLNFPDFRSNERAFNMLEQVSGRSGRRKERGRVLIQTSRPDDPVLGFVRNHDYEGFYESEIADRQTFGYPPFTKVIMLYVKNRNATAVDKAASFLAGSLRNIFGNRVLGPDRPFVSRIATMHLRSIMLKVEAAASMKKVKELCRRAYLDVASDPDVKSSTIYYDVDPV